MNRNKFLKTTIGAAGFAAFGFPALASFAAKKKKLFVGAHVWIYASTQPDYDVSNILPQIFSDMKYAGLDGNKDEKQKLRPIIIKPINLVFIMILTCTNVISKLEQQTHLWLLRS